MPSAASRVLCIVSEAEPALEKYVLAKSKKSNYIILYYIILYYIILYYIILYYIILYYIILQFISLDVVSAEQNGEHSLRTLWFLRLYIEHVKC